MYNCTYIHMYLNTRHITNTEELSNNAKSAVKIFFVAFKRCEMFLPSKPIKVDEFNSKCYFSSIIIKKGP
jgi:hypothetical protein